jgi:hypothetical protein
MVREYTHELQNEVRSISGGYTLEKEERIEMNGREVLYVVGSALADSSCCGPWACRYALVPGYVIDWKSQRDKNGIPISRVASITDERTRRELRELIEKQEGVSQVQFW